MGRHSDACFYEGADSGDSFEAFMKVWTTNAIGQIVRLAIEECSEWAVTSFMDFRSMYVKVCKEHSQSVMPQARYELARSYCCKV